MQPARSRGLGLQLRMAAMVLTVVLGISLFSSSAALQRARQLRLGPHRRGVKVPGQVRLLVDLDDPYTYVAAAKPAGNRTSPCSRDGRVVSAAEAALFEAVVAEWQPRAVLEVGCVVGARLPALAARLPARGTWLQVADVPRVEGTALEDAVAAVHEHALDDVVRVLPAKVSSVITNKTQATFDLVFLDHPHDDQDAVGLLDRAGRLPHGAHVVAAGVRDSTGLEAGNYLSWLRKLRHFRAVPYPQCPEVEVYRRV